MIDIIYPLTSDDNSLPLGSAAYRWSVLLQEGFAGNERPLNTALKYKDQLADVGFVDIVEVKEKWPISVWPRSKKYQRLGRHFFFFLHPPTGHGNMVLMTLLRCLGARERTASFICVESCHFHSTQRREWVGLEC